MKKKMLYDREICPNLTDMEKRCIDCIFWGDKAKYIDIIMLDGCPWEFKDTKSGEIIKENDLVVLSLQGCQALMEICPECVIVTNWKHQTLIPSDENYWRLEERPDFCKLIPNPENVLEMWCPNCHKIFTHDKVKHAIKSILILKEQFPKLFKKTK